MLEILQLYPDNHFDLVVTSPPYEDCRTYGIDFNLKGQEWVDWAAVRYRECVRVCKGLVVWVVEGKTRQFRWSATPALLMADLHRSGVKLRKPPAFHRIGIPGSGGPDWWRNDYEFCVASTKGKLPWSDNTANGKPPKWAPGGNPSHRIQDGRRVNVLKGYGRTTTPGGERGKGGEVQYYLPPEKANPGNVVNCKVGGGLMGSPLAHENEAPFPETLVEPFVKCFCPPDGVVLDPFCGSGTTLDVAVRLGRRATGIDIRQSQVDLTRERVERNAFYLEVGMAG